MAAIGPLTNVAVAPTGPHRMAELVVMGGDFGSDEPEHNLKCDVAAARAVFDAGKPISPRRRFRGRG